MVIYVSKAFSVKYIFIKETCNCYFKFSEICVTCQTWELETFNSINGLWTYQQGKNQVKSDFRQVIFSMLIFLVEIEDTRQKSVRIGRD